MTTKAQFIPNVPLDFEPQSKGPGQQLRQAREQLNLSKNDVAGRLHLRVCVIDAIEADDYANSPGLVFIRGYLRSYANLLNLSADNIIKAFNDLDIPEPRNERVVLRQGKKSPAINFKQLPLGWISTVIVGGLLLLIALWWHSQQPTTDSETKLQEAVIDTNPVAPVKQEKPRVELKSSMVKIPPNVFPAVTSHPAVNTTGANQRPTAR